MGFDLSSSMESPDFTYSYSKFSCVAKMHGVHVFFCYMVFLTGLAAMIVRVVPSLKFLHIWFGRAYIHCMLWATATSLLINNTGLPPAVLISFIWTMGGLSIGWVLINIHQMQMERKAIRNVQEDIKLSGASGAAAVTDLAAAIQKEKGRIADGKSWAQRVFSLKALHGAVFFTSWLNIAGRVFATGFHTDSWVCYTYPYYKPIDSPEFSGAGNETATPVPIEDPNYDRLPWAKTGLLAWGLLLSVGSMAACFLFGAVYSFFAARRSTTARHRLSGTGDNQVSGAILG